MPYIRWVMVEVKLPDGSTKKIEAGKTVLDVAKLIGAGLAKAAIAGKLDGKIVDLRMPIRENTSLLIAPKRA